MRQVRCRATGFTIKGEFVSSSSTTIVMKSSFGAMVFDKANWELVEI